MWKAAGYCDNISAQVHWTDTLQAAHCQHTTRRGHVQDTSWQYSFGIRRSQVRLDAFAGYNAHLQGDALINLE